MKKFLSLLTIACLLLVYIPPYTLANAETDNTSVQILDLKQDGESLVKDENGVYQLVSLNNVEVVFEASNFNENEYYSYSADVYNHDGTISSWGNFPTNIGVINGVNTYKFKPLMVGYSISDPNSLVNFSINKITDNTTWPNKTENLFSTQFKFYSQKTEEFLSHHAKISITDIKQNNQSLTKKGDSYVSNGVQGLDLSIRGTDIYLDETYKIILDVSKIKYNPYENIYMHDSSFIFTGQELMDGVNISLKDDVRNLDDYNVSLNCYTNDDAQLYIQTDYATGNFKVINNLDSSLSDFDITNIKYADYKDVPIEKPWGTGQWMVDNNYASQTNPLEINFGGTNFVDNQMYPVNVVLSNEGKVIESGITLVNGRLINQHKASFLISNTKFDVCKSYEYEISIEGVTRSIGFFVKEPGYVDTQVYYSNGLRSLSIPSGEGGYNYQFLGFAVNKNSFNSDNPLTFHYDGAKFTDSYDFDYKISYVQFKMGEIDPEDIDGKAINKKVVESGKVSGKELNESGLFHTINFKDLFLNTSVIIEISHNGDEVYTSTTLLNFVDEPVIGTLKLKSNNKNIYSEETDEFSGSFRYRYLTTNHGPLSMQVSGFGYIPNKDYEIEVYAIKPVTSGYEEIPDTRITKTVLGSQLNNGTVSIEYEKLVNYEGDCYIEVLTSTENPYGNGSIELKYVENSDFLNTSTGYVIDNLNDALKMAYYNSDSSDVIKNFLLKNNYTMKFYDKDNNEVSGKITTGMLARIFDQNGKSIFEFNVVLRGDVNGINGLSLTDLLKLRKQLNSGITLNGLYFSAGDINDSGSITVEDLDAVIKHLANIKEIE